MNYYSLQHKAPKASFREAVIRGIAPDRGLYFPLSITPLPHSFFTEIESLTNHEIAFHTIKQFVGDDIPEDALANIVADVLSFDFPLTSINGNTHSLELFHGPTLAFKDVGARFMARSLGYFSSQSETREPVTVLVATSGDTGGAVANGFLNVEGVNVVILYPSGKVSEIQEKQLTTLGHNITAIEVEGTFDDCQDFVKTAFLDEEITEHVSLTSANSINVARWLPQMFYYFIAYKKLKRLKKPLVFSVPSGNFGNICAGLMAWKLGLPIDHFVASVNANDVVPKYFETEEYIPKNSVSTISNAMDVGDPSNFVRILELFSGNHSELSKLVSSWSFTDAQTRAAMKQLYQTCGYIADPHGAVGYLGLNKYLQDHPEAHGVFLETAHPVKFLAEVEITLSTKLPIPTGISAILNKEKKAEAITSYHELKRLLLD